MPVLQRPDGEIHYEQYGRGCPILLVASGGMRSRAEMWHDRHTPKETRKAA